MDASNIMAMIFLVPMWVCLAGIAGCLVYEVSRLLKDWIENGSDNDKHFT